MGRELPPDEVLACDQRICWWAGELKKAGLEGGMDELRARAFLDLVLGKDSRPRARDGAAATARQRQPAAAAQQRRARQRGRSSRRARSRAARRAGSPGGSRLTVPLGTAAGLADRPGELGGHGPVDPWLARDLVNAAAARTPRQPGA